MLLSMISRSICDEWINRDPFDRLLICQAQAEGLVLVTADANIARYDVDVIW